MRDRPRYGREAKATSDSGLSQAQHGHSLGTD
jgi:hypothetical protein